ncbi:MAG: hypothetical protein SV966_06295 [Actinomycetota bacterium]|nr:hypothetical protein [Actinomycetota bacterium]
MIALAMMFALGLLVGRGSTPLDSRLLEIDAPDRLLVFVQAPAQVAALGAAVAYAAGLRTTQEDWEAHKRWRCNWIAVG